MQHAPDLDDLEDEIEKSIDPIFFKEDYNPINHLIQLLAEGLERGCFGEDQPDQQVELDTRSLQEQFVVINRTVGSIVQNHYADFNNSVKNFSATTLKFDACSASFT